MNARNLIYLLDCPAYLFIMQAIQAIFLNFTCQFLTFLCVCVVQVGYCILVFLEKWYLSSFCFPRYSEYGCAIFWGRGIEEALVFLEKFCSYQPCFTERENLGQQIIICFEIDKENGVVKSTVRLMLMCFPSQLC